MMRTPTIDLRRWTGAIQALEEATQQRNAQLSSHSERRFYELYTRFFCNFRQAVEEGKEIAAYYTTIPAEILYAMDLFPVLVQASCIGVSNLLGNAGECLDITKGFGLMQETCSGHRLMAAHFIQGWFPPLKVFVGGEYACDVRASGRLVAELYGCPAFFIDIPYYENESGIAYFVRELEDLIRFLEEQTGRKMDWDRLEEIVGRSAEMTRLHREVTELRRAIPSPMEGRLTWQAFFLNWLYAGTPEGVAWFRTLRDELKERLAQGKGAVLQERFRLLDLFVPPFHCLDRVLNWMEREKGAVIVNEPLATYWREWDGEMDPSRPLESLVRRLYNGPFGGKTLYGPGEAYCRGVVEIARDFRADGALWWNQNNCRQSGRVRGLKDVLRREVGIPTGMINMDICDPSFVSPEGIIDQLEEFFEVLEGWERERRKNWHSRPNRQADWCLFLNRMDEIGRHLLPLFHPGKLQGILLASPFKFGFPLV